MFRRKLIDLRREMPILARHEGDWEGEYIHIDLSGRVFDRHESLLSCMFPTDGNYPYYQINRYRWSDGKKEELHFPATYKDGRIWLNNDRIVGSVWEIDDRSLMVTWSRRDAPHSYLYEMIQISRDDKIRNRTWHWFQNDELIQRTLISERRIK